VQSGLAGLEFCTLIPGSLHQGCGITAAGTMDDQVALEGGGIDFQRFERSTYIAAAAGFVRELLQPAR
jgi:hypothetical protein